VAAVPFFWAGRGVELAEAYLRTDWYLGPSSCLATTDMGQKLETAVPLFGVAGSPSNTMWPGSRPTSVPSFILMHATVCPQYTNVTDRQTKRQDRQDRTDNGPIA